jgi:hypothetical protein
MILKALPTIIMIEALIACIPYAAAQQWGQALYWFAAGLINLAVIYLIPMGK